jgi:hypothetical protein
VIRPEFPNWSQPAEDAALKEVNTCFAAVLTRDRSGLQGGTFEFIAAWEGGYPEGDLFYENTSCQEVEVWLTLNTVHQGYFVFGVHADEGCFWKSLREMPELRDGCEAEYSGSAQQARVLFVVPVTQDTASFIDLQFCK